MHDLVLSSFTVMDAHYYYFLVLNRIYFFNINFSLTDKDTYISQVTPSSCTNISIPLLTFLISLKYLLEMMSLHWPFHQHQQFAFLEFVCFMALGKLIMIYIHDYSIAQRSYSALTGPCFLLIHSSIILTNYFCFARGRKPISVQE